MALAIWFLAGLADDPSLAQKAEQFRTALHERHLAPEGLVLYRISLSSAERDIASGNYPLLADTPTFTGLYAATSCARARVESDPAQALADARSALGGLRLLLDVTGVRGLLARGVVRDQGLAALPALDGRGRWAAGAAGFERYAYRSDVSADQYANGLLPAVAECAELFPEQTRRLIVDFAEHLLANEMQLVDARGNRTRFGDLSWRSGLGLNSIYQLTAYAALALAAKLDGDPRFERARNSLRDVYRVAARARRTNLRVFGITNYSNDLMAWNLYRVLIPLARAEADPALPELRHGMHRAWLRVRGDGNPYFAAVFCRIEPESCDPTALARGLQVLRAFPLDKRKIVRSPEQLQALSRHWLPGRKWKPRARSLVPMALRPVSSFEWKSSPYRVEGGELPDTEYTGLDFLSAYWLYRSLPAAP